MNQNITFRHFLSDNIEISTTAICTLHPPYRHFRRQYHEYILYYILSGVLFLEEDGVRYELKENDMIILDPSREHVGYDTSIFSFLYCHFSVSSNGDTVCWEESSQGIDHSIIIPKLSHFNVSSVSLDAKNIATRLASTWAEQRPHADILCSNMLLELLILSASEYESRLKPTHFVSKGKVAQTIPELIFYLNREYATEITSNELEQAFNYSFDYLNRQFKKWTGKTIFNYLNAIRVDQAKKLLESGYYTITDVASMTGFRDVYYFSRVFKKYTGMPPSQA